MERRHHRPCREEQGDALNGSGLASDCSCVQPHRAVLQTGQRTIKGYVVRHLRGTHNVAFVFVCPVNVGQIGNLPYIYVGRGSHRPAWHLTRSPYGPTIVATVTPSPPSLDSPSRKLFTRGCLLSSLRTAARNTPVPLPWMMRTHGSMPR